MVVELIAVVLVTPCLGCETTGARSPASTLEGQETNARGTRRAGAEDERSETTPRSIASSQVLFRESESAERRELPENPAIVRCRIVEVELGLLEGAREITLNLFDDVQLDARRDRLDKSGPDALVWVGHVKEADKSSITLAVRDDALAGSIVVDHTFYQVRAIGDGLHAILEIDQSAYQREAEPLPEVTTTTIPPRPKS